MPLLGLKQINSLLILIKQNRKISELFIDGITLKRETVTTFLGIFINGNVTWKSHINTNTISTKISESIGILYGARLIILRKQFN